MLNVCDVTHYSYVRVNGFFLTNRWKHLNKYTKIT